MGKKQMNKPDPSAASDGGGFDMTSMIDVTFLLLIFFMTCTEMADSSKSKMEVTRVENGQPDDVPEPDRLLINILKDGKVQINAVDYSEKALNDILHAHYVMSKGAAGETEKPIMIRADRRTKYKDVQVVMKMCMDQKLWKISFAALGKDPKGQQGEN